MTSANVIEYDIRKNGVNVGYHRENIMCKDHYEDLLKFEPLSEHTIMAFGYDEEEEYWENKPINLETYLKKLSITNKSIKLYFNEKSK